MTMNLNLSSISSSVLGDMMSDESMKRFKRKPNFTPQERMHLVRSYVESLEQYNRGFTAATKGEAKYGRQRLLERWAAELSGFGIVERTTIEVEQKLRDYMKKISANRRRPVKRTLSPAAELLSKVLPETPVTIKTDSPENQNSNDLLTEYADYLLQQHRSTSNENSDYYKAELLKWADCSSSGSDVINFCGANDVSKTMIKDNILAQNSIPETKEDKKTSVKNNDCCSTIHFNEVARIQHELLAQQLENARADYELKQIAIEAASLDVKIKSLEYEKMKLEWTKEKGELTDHIPNGVTSSATVTATATPTTSTSVTNIGEMLYENGIAFDE